MSHVPIRLGIVGCGQAARTIHWPAIARVPEFQVVALCDLDHAALANLAAGSTVKRFSNWRALLDHPGLDAVAVATPPDSHADIGCAVLQAGKHLVLDKPLAADLAGGEALLAAADGGQRLALLGLNFRWHRLVRQARDLVKAGAVGEVRAIRSVYTHCLSFAGGEAWQGRRAAGGGALVNDGIHHFDLWRFLLGRDIEEIALHTVHASRCQDDTCTVSARLSGGVLGSAVFSFSTGPASELEILGTTGRLQLSLYRFDGLRLIPATTHAGAFTQRARQALATLRALPAAVSGLSGRGDFSNSYHAMWRHFSRCIQGMESPEVSLRDGQQAMSALFAALAHTT